jgi:hypothetical protein
MTQNSKFTGMQLLTVPSDYVPVTPNDSSDLAVRAGGLYIGGTAGNIVVRTGLGGTTSRTIAVAANSFIPGEFTRVLSTGTTATPIHALLFRS